ncbi:hypothetical protein AB0F52_10450 [Amycolatopsis sp. NPDC024027]|uniref:hypothetical protein n=1 Tax=Amycolatopsis sp. NPDC024027 TaxID=3154327 RepID=UPI003406E249
MTELSRGGRNRKFLLTLAVLLVIFLFPLVHGLISGIGVPDAAPATPDPGPATVDILAVPGPGTAAGFDACSVLSPDVVAAAGLKYASGIARTGPEPGRAPGTNSCGAPVGPQRGSVPPVVLLTVGEQQVSGTARSHGEPYDRGAGESPADTVVTFPPARLKITHFAALTDGETAVAKLIDGIAARLAEGPKPAPEYRYPAPYDLVAKPCDALPAELFRALTGHPTDGTESETLAQHEVLSVSGTDVKISCARASTAGEAVAVTQTIYRDADGAGAETRFLCEHQPGWTALPAPIGDFSCASPATGGQHRILFRAGRDRVLLEYRADHPPAGDLAGTARKIFDALPH